MDVVWLKQDKDEEAASSTIIDLLIVIGSAMNEIKDVLGFLVHYVFSFLHYIVQNHKDTFNVYNNYRVTFPLTLMNKNL